MAFQSRITSKGQVTVPAHIRRKLGLRQGDRVEFAEKGRDTIIRRAPHEENPFDRYVGAVNGFKNIKEINRWIADMRDDEGGD